MVATYDPVPTISLALSSLALLLSLLVNLWLICSFVIGKLPSRRYLSNWRFSRPTEITPGTSQIPTSPKSPRSPREVVIDDPLSDESGPSQDPLQSIRQRKNTPRTAQFPQTSREVVIDDPPSDESGPSQEQSESVRQQRRKTH